MNFPNRVPVLANPQEGSSIWNESRALKTLLSCFSDISPPHGFVLAPLSRETIKTSGRNLSVPSLGQARLSYNHVDINNSARVRDVASRRRDNRFSSELRGCLRRQSFSAPSYFRNVRDFAPQREALGKWS